MKTLVEKLYDADDKLCTEAAEEIERLCAQLDARVCLEIELEKRDSDIKHLKKFIANIARENEVSLLEVARLSGRRPQR